MIYRSNSSISHALSLQESHGLDYNVSNLSSNITMLIHPHLKGESFFIPGNDTGILLLHGATATTAEVRLLGEHLANEGYSVLAPLLPGHATSIKDLNNTKWQEWITTAESAYNELSRNCQHIIVGGESVGALLALYLTYQHPEIRGVLLYSPAFAFNYSFFTWIFIYLSSPFITALKKNTKKHNQHWQGYNERPLKLAIEIKKLQHIIRTNLKQIQQPTLLAFSTIDEVVSVEAIQQSAKILPNIKDLIKLEGDEHIIILGDKRMQIFQQTVAFIQKIQQPHK